jgi:hypothetical protein
MTTNKLEVPDDFPHPEMASAIAGFQNKLALIEYDGKFYMPGGTPPERHHSWLQCEDRAALLAEKCLKNQSGKYAHLQRIDILDQYCVRMLATLEGFSPAEIRWIVKRTAAILGWPEPPTVQEKTVRPPCDQ